jgi:hypothetical protein
MLSYAVLRLSCAVLCHAMPCYAVRLCLTTLMRVDNYAVLFCAIHQLCCIIGGLSVTTCYVDAGDYTILCILRHVMLCCQCRALMPRYAVPC